MDSLTLQHPNNMPVGNASLQLAKVVAYDRHLPTSWSLSGGVLRFGEDPSVFRIMIRAEGVQLNMLAAENGDPTLEAIARLEGLAGNKLFPVMCQQTNFELLGRIPIRNAEVFRIVEPSSNSTAEPNLAPYLWVTRERKKS